MFGGVSAYDAIARVQSFAQARAVLEQLSARPRRRVASNGDIGMKAHSKPVCWVGERAEGAIAFRLYETDVVVWHPDNSVVIENYGTTTTSGFARRFLPDYMHLSYPVCRRGEEGGHRGIHYRSSDGIRMVCFGDLVRMVPAGDGSYAPDPDTLDDVCFAVLDPAKARAVARQYPFREFDNWLAMVPRMTRVEHDGEDIDTALGALRARDFPVAAAHLPTVDTSRLAFGAERRIKPLPIITAGHSVVLQSSVERLRLAAYEDADALDTVVLGALPVAKFDRLMVMVRKLRAIDCPARSGWRLGMSASSLSS